MAEVILLDLWFLLTPPTHLLHKPLLLNLFGFLRAKLEGDILRGLLTWRVFLSSNVILWLLLKFVLLKFGCAHVGILAEVELSVSWGEKIVQFRGVARERVVDNGTSAQH